MSDRIYIDGLEIFANHGVLAEEVSLGQKFIVSVCMMVDLEDAGREDDLNCTINYAKTCEYINEYVKSNTFNLIETVADGIARGLLTNYEMLKEVSVTVKKPWAPIGYPLECVSVTVERSWHTVYLSIGSNMGDKCANLDFAVKALGESEDIKVTGVSSYITTPPYGMTEQDEFLNGAVEIRTICSPERLLDIINEIESKRGRTRDIHWGPRTLDIDILLYDDVVINSKRLTIPHQDMVNRKFVLEPMNEIAPWAIHPINRMTMAQLLEKLQ